VLQSLHLGHCAGQLNQVDIGAVVFVENLDASHQVVCEADLDGAIAVGCSTGYGKSFFCCHDKVAFFKLI
jgi:hypothetical protein